METFYAVIFCCKCFGVNMYSLSKTLSQTCQPQTAKEGFNYDKNVIFPSFTITRTFLDENEIQGFSSA